MIKQLTKKSFLDQLNKQAAPSQDKETIFETAKTVIQAIREEKDAALFQYIEKFDGPLTGDIEVSKEERKAAWEKVDQRTIQALERAAANIRKFHQKQIKESKFMQHDAEIVSGQLYRPIEKVGIYVPGGTACYPSSVLMNAIPAALAGVEKVIMVSPARQGGEIAPILSVAADISGVDTIYKVGGIQAVAALSYGTESVEKVDKIVGPGNAYVAAAKSLVYGDVGIDMIAGPSEVAIIADESAKAKHIASDLIAQAEHDTLARAYLFTTSKSLIEETERELVEQLEALPRQAIATEALTRFGGLVLVTSLTEAFELSNLMAPEHLEVQIDHALDYLRFIKHAGSVFLGHYTPESLGDYYAGPNHVLPTSGTAKFSSGLSVDDFVKKTTFLYYSKEALEQSKDDIVTIATEEQLAGHARAVLKRFED
ncbi:histidinol dehydrogenase [Streptohalobacillus salinus]|uniref:Histidinol dehydrogenase n=1 Tax=Streptohalobacillus salinus TaxID=621096 RepID=A0A2V3WCE4_9BACI|nr:histidinol dehydrogenase [Streptohalobacillus salinus]PXW91850.1 histidinol dehydrogenase [Streptohalobacillus salinus]